MNPDPALRPAPVLFRLAQVRPWMWFGITGLFALAVLIDGVIIDSMPERKERLKDFHRMLRIAGFLPTWVFVGAVLACAAWGTQLFRQRVTEAVAVVLNSAIAGGLAALLKIVIRRPDIAKPNADGTYPPYEGWRVAPLGDEPWDGTDLCCPSEHSAISYGAVVMLARLYPRASIPLLLIGFGTAAMRVRQRGHHPSDTVVSLALALGVSILVPKMLAKLSTTKCGARLGLRALPDSVADAQAASSTT